MMKKITGLNTVVKKVGGQPFTKSDGSPVKIGDTVLDCINAYAFPQKPTIKDLKQMGKIMELGERIYQCVDEITLEDADFEMLKNVLNPPLQIKVAAVVVQVMKVIDEAEDVKTETDEVVK